jgi:phosphate acetyltransferase
VAESQSTVDAAALCKMADRSTAGCAIGEAAAWTKGIVSPVAGQAHILLVSDLEAGSMLAKQLQYPVGADSAGIVLGARISIVLTSRAASVRTCLGSTAVMALVADA